ncbi:hypothetical protein F5882DRAFT_164067 [Hyaloscypha sp. PMI_1271]|nr:hypothetical protein F5882DRAFT_164067 [Hyaloscypha sp. PMI_1271]
MWCWMLDAGCSMDQVGSRLWLWLRFWAGILLYMYSGNAPLCCCCSSSSSSSCCLKVCAELGRTKNACLWDFLSRGLGWYYLGVGGRGCGCVWVRVRFHGWGRPGPGEISVSLWA